MRDITLEDTFRHDFTTRAFATGIPTVLAGTPVLSVLEEDNVTPITSGVSVAVNRASVVGLNEATIVATAANGYEVGKSYSIYISTGTVGGVSVVGEVVGQFTVETQAGSAKLTWDRILTGATHNISTSAGRRLRELQDLGAYEGGSVWVDTVDGVAGTEDFVNGTVNNPSLTIADARTIADSVGLHRFTVVSGSSITLAQTFNNFQFEAVGAAINMGGQDVGGTRFIGANLTGTGTGSSRIVVRESILTGAVIISSATFIECNLSTSSLTLSSAAKYIFFGCIAGDAEGGQQVIDYGAAVVNTDCVFQKWSGGLDFRNMGQSGTDTLVIEGMGNITFNVNCTGGTATLVGVFGVTNNGSVTVDTTIELSEIKGSTFDASTDTLEDIRNDTNELQTDWVNGGRLDLILDIIAADTTTDIPALIAALQDISAADVLTQVNAALDTAIAELGVAQPTATPTIRTGLMLLYMALRNRTDVQTSATDALEIHNAAGTQITSKLLTDAGGDYSEAQMT